jgi:hypothetical protein
VASPLRGRIFQLSLDVRHGHTGTAYAGAAVEHQLTAKIFRQLLRLGWKEAVLVGVLILTSLGIDGWSVWSIRGGVRNVKTAQSLSTQAIQDTKGQKVELDQKITDFHATYDSKIGDLEKEIENLRKTKRDK